MSRRLRHATHDQCLHTPMPPEVDPDPPAPPDRDPDTPPAPEQEPEPAPPPAGDPPPDAPRRLRRRNASRALSLNG
jgi:hypothetical protein